MVSHSSPEFALEYQALTDDELLQLWVERSQLTAEAKEALQTEIRKRNLAAEAEHAIDRRALPPKRTLAPPPANTFFGASVLWFWIRELWFRCQTKDGITVEAHVDSTRMTRHANRSAARAELRYWYQFEGVRYNGRAVRDFLFNSRAADALAFSYRREQKIAVRIDREHPNRSYFPTGFGWIETLLVGSAGLVCCTAVATLLLGIAYEAIFR